MPGGVVGYPARNSLNLIRLLLASTVIFAHAFYVTGAGFGPVIHGDNLGGWAVYGFFGISGYLVTHSRLSHPLGEYLVHRLARLMPAYWVCLLMMVLVFGPLGYLVEKGSLGAYWTTATHPLNYLFSNSTLRVSAYDIAGTPSTVPFAGVWNGSIWTLYYEFICYLVIAAFLTVPFVRRRAFWVIGLAWLASASAYVLWDAGLSDVFGGNGELAQLLKLLPLFLGGAVLRAAGDRIQFRFVGALVGAVILAAGILVLDRGAPQLAAPAVAYALLWLGTWLPSARWVQRNDISYGTYVYAFPAQQLLAVTGLGMSSVALHILLAVAVTVPLAVGSWFLVERPVMRAVKRRPRGAPRPV